MGGVVAQPQYDAILLVSFGGPEKPEEVMPFLETVTAGRDVPQKRLEKVAEHYHALGGRSPINDLCRDLIERMRVEFGEHDIDLPIYWGNRNWHPFLADTFQNMADDGIKRALAFVTSAYSSYSGCRQYLEAIERAREQIGEGAPEVDKLRVFYNHPLFIEAVATSVRDTLDTLEPTRRQAARIAFTAHSIPVDMADASDYQVQLEEACELVAKELDHSAWQLVFQSRSGPPQVPWLKPDILDHLDALATIGANDVVIVPIGFVLDHVEVVWDLDHEAKERGDELGIHVLRAPSAGNQPAFVAMIRELIEERLGRLDKRRSLGSRGSAPDVCAPDCCAYATQAAESVEDAGED